jgi:hypothetical protein
MQAPVYQAARGYITPGNGDRTDNRTVYSDPTLSPVSGSSDTGGPGNRTTSGPGTDNSGFFSGSTSGASIGSSGSGRTSSGPGTGNFSPSDPGYSGNNPTGYISQATSTPSALYQSPNTYQDYNPGYSDYSNIGGIP